MNSDGEFRKIKNLNSIFRRSRNNVLLHLEKTKPPGLYVLSEAPKTPLGHLKNPIYNWLITWLLRNILMTATNEYCFQNISQRFLCVSESLNFLQIFMTIILCITMKQAKLSEFKSNTKSTDMRHKGPTSHS